MTPDEGNPIPVGSVLFSSRNLEGVLTWEAGVGAMKPISHGRLFVEQRGPAQTTIAMVAPPDEGVTVGFVLRDSQGMQMSQIDDQVFAPGENKSLFVSQLVPGLSEFTGSLTFEAQEGQGLGAISLRANQNLDGKSIFSTLPVLDLDRPVDTNPIVLPQIGAGSGLSTQIVLVNTSDQPVSVRIELFENNPGLPLELSLDGVSASVFVKELEGNGTYQGELTLSEGVKVGYLVVTLLEGSHTPLGSAVFQYRSGDAVISEAGVPAAPATTAFRMFVDNKGTQTGLALASLVNLATLVELTLLDQEGNTLEVFEFTLSARGHWSNFMDLLFENVDEGFVGQLKVVSSNPVSAVSLKLTLNQFNRAILTTLPIAVAGAGVQSGSSPAGFAANSLVFPRIGFGDFGNAVLDTRLILIGDQEKESRGKLDFFQDSGSPMQLSDVGTGLTYRLKPSSVNDGTLESLVSKLPMGAIFVDPALEACVRSNLGLFGSQPLTLTMAQGLRTLTCRSQGISNLDGIENLTGLSRLTLESNLIVNVAPLSGLTRLKILRLRSNAISETSALAPLTKLETLRLDSNSISDVRPLLANSGLGLGDYLSLQGNPLDAGDCADLQVFLDRGMFQLRHDVRCP